MNFNLRLSKEGHDGLCNAIDHEEEFVLGDIVRRGDDDVVSLLAVIGSSAWV